PRNGLEQRRPGDGGFRVSGGLCRRAVLLWGPGRPAGNAEGHPLGNAGFRRDGAPDGRHEHPDALWAAVCDPGALPVERLGAAGEEHRRVLLTARARPGDGLLVLELRARWIARIGVSWRRSAAVG